ncbi:hypothetical protein CsatA_001324 [Cannabis sativa]
MYYFVYLWPILGDIVKFSEQLFWCSFHVWQLGRKKTNTSETHLNSGSGINHSGLKRRQKVLSVVFLP